MLLNKLKNNEYVDWDIWYNRELISLCNLYIDIKFCKKYNDQLAQFEAFISAVEFVWQHKEEMVEKMVVRSKGLRDYLILHSVFGTGENQNDDWLVNIMLKILMPTQDDIQRILAVEPVPKELLDKLSMFDPEPIGIEMDSIRIEYCFWGKRDPIAIIDSDWEDTNQVNVTEFINKFAPIDAGVKILAGEIDFETLPF